MKKVEYGIMSNKWSVNTEYVDGENIKADTWYKLESGRLGSCS